MRFRGTFARFGRAVVRYRFAGKLRTKEVVTLVLTNVTDDCNRPLTDHLWFKCGKQFAALNLQPGERVEFTARVERYYKRRRDEFDGESYLEGDYCLKRPTNMMKLGAHDSAGNGLLFVDAFISR